MDGTHRKYLPYNYNFKTLLTYNVNKTQNNNIHKIQLEVESNIF